MTPPPTPARVDRRAAQQTNLQTLHGAPPARLHPGADDDDTTGPLVRQPAPAARLARVLFNASMELQDACVLQDSAQMWEEARAIASRILTSCPL